MMLDKIETRSFLAVEVGATIRRMRKERGMTLAQLATFCRTTPQTLQRLEVAQMTLDVEWIEIIASGLGVEPSAFFPQPTAEFVAAMSRRMAVMREEAESLKLRLEQAIRHIDAFIAGPAGTDTQSLTHAGEAAA